jgi:fatty-acyl-CoA synthase
VEDCIYLHPAVQDVQIVAIPSVVYGEEAFAFVILKAGEKASEKDIKDFVAKRLSRHKVPAHVAFVAKYSTTASGKIKKFELREDAKKILNITADTIEFKDKEE